MPGKSEPKPEPLLVAPREAARLLGVGRSTLWELIRAGRLERRVITRRRIGITMASVHALAAGMTPPPERTPLPAELVKYYRRSRTKPSPEADEEPTPPPTRTRRSKS